jgi:hypothetical protein
MVVKSAAAGSAVILECPLLFSFLLGALSMVAVAALRSVLFMVVSKWNEESPVLCDLVLILFSTRGRNFGLTALLIMKGTEFALGYFL